ncbi:tau-tubulin kinase 1 [Anaeramoeba ignava]|uniref:non-specific serine/threonine protein kinase n=1 Tax=Anaeramoeba ignava TaxID=1746090 RepID=A0A9Q0LFG0_ANAIG|nr:tau-tubulin kinase 1 [Anaeramoeba ignava]
MIGKVLRARWAIDQKLGQGAFGEIYSAQDLDTDTKVAIKVEKKAPKRETLKIEVSVMKRFQKSSYSADFISCGRFDDYYYVVMDLLGPNLAELKRKTQKGRFSLATTMKLGIEMISSIEDIHEIGYIHRDIKSSNFLIRKHPVPENKKFLVLIDFGLARKFVDNENNPRPSRGNVGFRGTARYASIDSHEGNDLGRKDDLWSLFYVLIEFAQGELPWRTLKEKEEIKEMKKRYDTPNFCQNLPKEFVKFYEHLKGLKFEDKPDYEYLRNLFRTAISRLKLDQSGNSDFEMPESIHKIYRKEEGHQSPSPKNGPSNDSAPANLIFTSLAKSYSIVFEPDQEFDNGDQNPFFQLKGRQTTKSMLITSDIFNSPKPIRENPPKEIYLPRTRSINLFPKFKRQTIEIEMNDLTPKFRNENKNQFKFEKENEKEKENQNQKEKENENQNQNEKENENENEKENQNQNQNENQNPNIKYYTDLPKIVEPNSQLKNSKHCCSIM